MLVFIFLSYLHSYFSNIGSNLSHNSTPYFHIPTTISHFPNTIFVSYFSNMRSNLSHNCTSYFPIPTTIFHFPNTMSPVRLSYFFAMKQCFPLIIFYHKHQHKQNFSISKQSYWFPVSQIWDQIYPIIAPLIFLSRPSFPISQTPPIIVIAVSILYC